MAALIWSDAFLSVNDVDLSDHVQEMTLNYSAEMLDASVMGVGTRVNMGGLKNWSVDVTFKQNFAAGSVDATLWSLVGTSADIEVRPTNACTTAINPRFYGVGVVERYNPGAGAVGVLHQSQVAIQNSGALSRSTTAT